MAKNHKPKGIPYTQSLPQPFYDRVSKHIKLKGISIQDFTMIALNEKLDRDELATIEKLINEK